MLKEMPLGKTTEYIQTYTPSLLFPVPRKLARDLIGLKDDLPFHGVDIWNGYELSWLNLKGKPEIAVAEFVFPSTSPSIVESKSFKLYLNSFNQSKFASHAEVARVMQKDLSAAIGASVEIKIYPPKEIKPHHALMTEFKGRCLDDLDVEIDTFVPDFTLLRISDHQAEETLFTHLLKSNCLATGQPDWGTVLIRYAGPKIDSESLLKYIVSYRNHSGFAEHCVEQIYCDILKACRPEKLSVYCRYTRRGGLDINPFRSNFESVEENNRQIRQ